MGEAKARMNYIKLGSELTRTIKQIAQWRFGRQLGQVKLLEFACGYGRNVRHLVHVFPRRNITVSDIMEKAVRFNMEQFQVAGRLSVHDPADLDWSERFDMIVVPSLFSHLPARTFAGWIAALYGLLAEDGILVFSVLGDNVLDDRVAMPETGIHYELHSENEVLDKEEYGLAHVTDSFVRDQVIKATGRTDYGLIERGFWKVQNVYMLTCGDLVEPASFHYDRGLIGNIDQVTLQIDGTMRISGWAAETNQATNLNVTACAYLDGARVAEWSRHRSSCRCR
jgi:SAM-dependent methyltransferase